ncbi:MAG: 4Fe-4S dicluster domain-containing protein [Chloroflexi bacterium]|nr:4Fe-4S dicluster domain-containing protein [Chloroflexota bacterium]
MGTVSVLAGQLFKGARALAFLGGGSWLGRGGAARAAVEQSSADAAAAAGATKYNPWDHKWSIGMDIEKCIGCGRCVEACKLENGVPLDPFYFRTWVERYAIMRDGTVNVDSPNGGFDGFPEQYDARDVAKGFFVPKMCNHCEDSPCDQVCPVGATFRAPDGVVLIDKDYCIGCRYCIQACPYGCRFFNPETRTADKCTMCYHRITKGLQPACVEVCPTGARLFGDLKDRNSKIWNFLDTHQIGVLKEHMGTRPKVFYNGLDKEVH